MCNRNVALASTKPDDQSGTLIDQLIALSGAQHVDRITVAGRKALDVLLGLCRRGFLHATCQTATPGPHVEDSSDSLWILATQDTAELRTLIAKCGRDLRSGGTLIIGFDRDSSADGALRFRDVLVKCGFIPVQQAHSRDHRFLLCARKRERHEAMAA
ncbi:MAG TPA: hypothetical protein VK479_10595 [Micropepsaceae bacterium]|nr:hypothetical protein [Micropepsaceae bacterium]